MGTKFWEAVCDEHGIGGSGEYCGYSYAHFGHIGVFYHEFFLAKSMCPARCFSTLSPA
jgi:hypothetical protein